MGAESSRVHEQVRHCGTIAHPFIRSKLTLLLVIAALAVGAFSILEIAREEEPQIVVPMIDVFVQMPGASAKEVEERISAPLELLIRDIPGVEYVYSASQPGAGMVTARFYVGQKEDDAIVQTFQEAQWRSRRNAHGCKRTAGQGALHQRRSHDGPHLSGKNYDSTRLRMVASEIERTVKQVDDVSVTEILGGQPRRVNVSSAQRNLPRIASPPAFSREALQASNYQNTPIEFAAGGSEKSLQAGSYLTSVADVQDTVVVGAAAGHPVFLRDVAQVTESPAQPDDYVLFAPGKAFQNPPDELPAVTITIAKRAGANATVISQQIEERLAEMRGPLIPPDLHVAITRNYGETAKDKSDELLEHLLIATLSVTLLIGLLLAFVNPSSCFLPFRSRLH